jgi:CRISP-associated protein Cas1
MVASAVPELVPARMLNEHVYCPRLAYLEWVDARFEDSADTVEGRWVHRTVDVERGAPPQPDHLDDETPRTTSLTISSEPLGLIAKIDVLESQGRKLVPLEYKRGRPTSSASPLWEPELIQLCAQVLLLRESGYVVDHAEVYFSETRTRHRIDIDQPLVEQTLAAITELRANAARDQAPPPLVDSPKCPRCSLIGLCLPDEVNALQDRGQRHPRRLVAGDPAATPLYATTPGGRVSKQRGRVLLKEEGREVASRRLIDVSHIGLFGNVDVSSALLRACFEAGIPILCRPGWSHTAASRPGRLRRAVAGGVGRDPEAR